LKLHATFEAFKEDKVGLDFKEASLTYYGVSSQMYGESTAILYTLVEGVLMLNLWKIKILWD